MSIHRSWEFYGQNKDGTFLTGRQIEDLIALDEFDFKVIEWEDDVDEFGWGDTESTGAYERVFEALIQYAEMYPDVTLTVYVSVDRYQDGFRMENGKVREFTGQMTYFYDDDGTEVIV